MPLISLIGASNGIPEDPWLKAAFGDRFVMRLELKPVSDDQLEELLSLGWSMERDRVEQTATEGDLGGLTRIVKQEDLKALHARLAEVEIEAIRPDYAALIRELRAEGVSVSDRRAVRARRCYGRPRIPTQDFAPLRHLWTRQEEAERVRDLVNRHMSDHTQTSSRSGEASSSSRYCGRPLRSSIVATFVSMPRLW